MSASAILGRLPVPGARAAGRDASGARLLVPLELARASVFVCLLVFGALHWMTLLEPTDTRRAWYVVGLGVLVMLALLGARALDGARRRLALAATCAGAAALAVLAAGVPDELLKPRQWEGLAAGVIRGIEAVPGARVPYRGTDEWSRVVIALGGSALGVLGALFAFWPRRRPGRLGVPLLALVVLVTLYAVPAIALDHAGQLGRGVLLTVLVIAFLRLERLRAVEARSAAWLTAGAVFVALVLTPLLDRENPWWDYETWALSSAASKTTAFAWDHDYGPLDWPRDGREVLRVRAPRETYWKATNLDVFDGEAWRVRASSYRPDPSAPRTPGTPYGRYVQEVQVRVSNLRSSTFITSGSAFSVEMPGVNAVETGVPGILRPGSRTLHRGDAYTVRTYTPTPNERELRSASAEYEDWLAEPYLTLGAWAGPNSAAGTPTGPQARLDFPTFSQQALGREPVVQTRYAPSYAPGFDEVAAEGSLKRAWDLAQRLRRRSATPHDYVRAVERHLAGPAFVYSESPGDAARTLDGFLFEARAGFCQQYAGAMALLLRMGGVPARVASGFTTGSRDEDTREWVVRDLDAHSWVEAWYPGHGWVQRDPTPAATPARSQVGDRPLGGGGDASAPDLGGGDAAESSASSAPAEEAGGGGVGWERIALLAGLGATLLAGLAVVWQRRRARPGHPDPLAELERALRRARRDLGPGATLARLEAELGRSPAAAGYLRALREQRYGARTPAAPTPAQRRGLRAELARDGGWRGRLLAWWALPPRALSR